MSGVDPHAMLATVLEEPHKLGWLAGKTLLTELHSKWIWDLWGQPAGVHTGIQAHRGGYKTTACTEVGIIWWLLTHPNENILLIRETWTEACKTLKAISQYMKVPEIKALFKLAHGIEPKTTTDKSGALTFNFKTSISKESSIDAYGGASVPTGSHYGRILFDDLITWNDRASKAKRELSKEILREVMTNIVNRGGSVHNVGTPWHKDDGWGLIVDDFGINIERYDCYETGLIDTTTLAKLKRTTTPSLFAANYELKHMSDEGAVFRDPLFCEWDHSVPYQWVTAHLDAKFGGDHYNALTITSKRKLDSKIQVWGKVFPEHIDKVMPRIKEIMFKFRCAKIHVETNPDKGYVGKLLASNPATQFKIRPARVCEYHEAMDKHIKIVTFGRHYWDRLLFASDTDQEYMNQILDYREGQEPDDAPDSLASNLRQEYYPTDPANRGSRKRWELD